MPGWVPYKGTGCLPSHKELLFVNKVRKIQQVPNQAPTGLWL